MKTALLVVLLVVVSVSVMGCLTTQQQSEINRTTLQLAEKIKDLEKYEEALKDIAAQLNAGTIPLAEGKALYEGVKEDIEDTKETAAEYQAVIERIQGEGGSGLDIATGILLSLINIGGALLGVRVWRGSVNARMGDIGVTK